MVAVCMFDLLFAWVTSHASQDVPETLLDALPAVGKIVPFVRSVRAAARSR